MEHNYIFNILYCFPEIYFIRPRYFIPLKGLGTVVESSNFSRTHSQYCHYEGRVVG